MLLDVERATAYLELFQMMFSYPSSLLINRGDREMDGFKGVSCPIVFSLNQRISGKSD